MGLDLETKPWLRQASDDEQSWLAFVAYRDQRQPRRLEPLRCTPPGGRAPSWVDLQRWYLEGRWAVRVAAWDSHCEAVRLAEREALLRDDERENSAAHRSLVQDARELAARELAKLLATANETEGSVLRPADVVRLTEAAVKLDRLIREKTTENPGFIEMSPEQARRVREALKGA